jgi:hypothetical protein
MVLWQAAHDRVFASPQFPPQVSVQDRPQKDRCEKATCIFAANRFEDFTITLPFGGQFDEHALVVYVHASGLDYIIQGQEATSLVNHRKPHSLDYWLRPFGVNRDTKQADNDVLDALVATGLFLIDNNLICPDSGERCKGIRLVAAVT